MVGVEAYRNAMHQLRRLRDARGFQLFALTHGPSPDYFFETCRAEDIPWVTAWDATLAYVKERGGGSFRDSDLVISKTDIHPSASGHRLHAEVLFRHMQDSELAERLVRQARRR